MVNIFTAQVRQSDPKALRKFLHTVRRSRTHQEAWETLGLEQRTYYRLLAWAKKEGHLCD